jgi:tRNA threonylcarbamoyl adenosine modification protein (Sua5/YciO/YrdC/YwlC family)
MIEYVIGKNPDYRILERAKKMLEQGEVISFPTESHWVFAASPFSKKGVEKLYRIKHISKHKHLSLLCHSISQASEMAIISNAVFRQLKRAIPGAYTFIFEPTKQLPRVIKNYEKDKEIGIRFPSNRFAHFFLEFISFPLLSTSITPYTFSDSAYAGEEEVLSYQIDDIYGHSLGMIIDPDCGEILGNSSIVDFSKGDIPIVIREGEGDISYFI